MKGELATAICPILPSEEFFSKVDELPMHFVSTRVELFDRLVVEVSRHGVPPRKWTASSASSRCLVSSALHNSCHKSWLWRFAEAVLNEAELAVIEAVDKA